MPQTTRVQRQEIELPADAPDSFVHFQALVRPLFELTRLCPQDAFFARVAITFLPDVLLSHAANGPARFERNALTIARSGIDDILVLVYLSGPFSCVLEDREQVVQAREIAFFDLARPFSIQGDQIDTLCLHVSRRRLERLMPSQPLGHGLVLRHGALQQLLLAQMRTCDQLAPQITTPEAAPFSDALLQLVAAGLKHAGQQASGPGTPVGPVALTEVTHFIDEHLPRVDLGPDDLAQAFGLSRATLYRLFEPLGGVAAYILDRRLARALQALSAAETAHLRLKQVAHAVGFAHPASFSRAFKKRFGMPPHEVRSLRAFPDEVQSAAWRQAIAAQTPRVSGAPRAADQEPPARAPEP